jgi:hypothetical protein
MYKLWVLPLSIKTTTDLCFMYPLILNVFGEEIPMRAWRDMTGSSGSIGGVTDYGMRKDGCVSFESGSSADRLYLEEVEDDPSIWKKFCS